MTSRVSDWQSKSDLDSVCNSCDVYHISIYLYGLKVLVSSMWPSSKVGATTWSSSRYFHQIPFKWHYLQLQSSSCYSWKQLLSSVSGGSLPDQWRCRQVIFISRFLSSPDQHPCFVINLIKFIIIIYMHHFNMKIDLVIFQQKINKSILSYQN